MAVAAAVAMVAISPQGARDAVSAVAFYLATYLFMNLGAFGIVALLRNRLKSEEISSYAGLIHVSPWNCHCHGSRPCESYWSSAI